MAFRFCSGTDPGRKRANNQDSLLADPELQLYVVADGMGGHVDGGLASQLVIDSIRTFFVETSLDENKTWPFGFDLGLSYGANRLRAAVLTANLKIANQIAASQELKGMGATVAAVLINERRAIIANVGDCRAYLAADGKLRQLTRDHSWVADQVRSGFLAPDSARTHPWRHMVTRAIQGNADLEVDIQEIELPVEGRLLLCSDGLHGILPDDYLASRLMRHRTETVDGLCASLIQEANERGAPDNVSAIAVEW